MVATFVKQWSIQPVAAAFWLTIAGLASGQEAVPPPVQDPSTAESQASDEEIGNPAVSKPRPAHLVVLRLSAAMLAAQMNRECDRQSAVREVVLGTPVTGVARLVGRLHVKPTPSTDRASFNATFSGTVYSRTVGRNGPVTIHGHSITRITASKEIFFEPGKGFHGGAPKISAQTQCFTDAITPSRDGLMGRIIQRRAAEEVAAKQPTLTALARDRASRRVAAAFEEHMAERLAQLNRAVDFQTRLAELRAGDGMRRLMARTTPEYLEIADAIYPNQTATVLPALSKGSGNYPIELWIHGSLVPEKIGQALATIFTNPDQSAVVNAMAMLPGPLGKEAAATLTALASENKVAVQNVGEWMVVELNAPVVSKTVAAAARARARR